MLYSILGEDEEKDRDKKADILGAGQHPRHWI